MVYTILVLAPRKAGIPHADFKARYEQHMKMVAGLCGDATPLSHTRYYPRHDSATDKPLLLAGDANEKCYAAVVLMEFENEAAFQRFHAALLTEDANAKIEADEAGFWEREGMKCMVVDTCRSWGP